MNNKDMPAATITLDQEQMRAALMALHVAQSHVIFNEDRKAMRDLSADIKAALAELEKRNG